MTSYFYDKKPPPPTFCTGAGHWDRRIAIIPPLFLPVSFFSTSDGLHTATTFRAFGDFGTIYAAFFFSQRTCSTFFSHSGV
jgi:hypothetical protein